MQTNTQDEIAGCLAPLGTQLSSRNDYAGGLKGVRRPGSEGGKDSGSIITGVLLKDGNPDTWRPDLGRQIKRRRRYSWQSEVPNAVIAIKVARRKKSFCSTKLYYTTDSYSIALL